MGVGSDGTLGSSTGEPTGESGRFQGLEVVEAGGRRVLHLGGGEPWYAAGGGVDELGEAL